MVVCSNAWKIWPPLLFFSLYSSYYQAKIPDIEKCLDVVATLQVRKGTGEVRSYFGLEYFLLSFTLNKQLTLV